MANENPENNLRPAAHRLKRKYNRLLSHQTRTPDVLLEKRYWKSKMAEYVGAIMIRPAAPRPRERKYGRRAFRRQRGQRPVPDCRHATRPRAFYARGWLRHPAASSASASKAKATEKLFNSDSSIKRLMAIARRLIRLHRRRGETHLPWRSSAKRHQAGSRQCLLVRHLNSNSSPLEARRHLASARVASSPRSRK